MLRSAPRAAEGQAKPDVKRIVDELLLENSNFDRTDNRSAHRDYLVRPVTIEMRFSDYSLTGFSRNISPTGIGIITSQPVSEKSVAVLKIARLKGKDDELLAICRWCKSYGGDWHLSGWEFLSVKR